MLLQYLLENLTNVEISGQTNREINKIEYNSNKIKNGDVFVAITGYKDNGIKYIDDAISKGAVAIVHEGDIEHKEDITYIKVENARIALAIMASTYYGDPARKLKMIGITGTKGKTTKS